MATQLRLLRHQLTDLAIIRDLKVEAIQRLIEAIRGMQPLPLRPETLRHVIAQSLTDNPEAVESLIRQILSLYPLMAQMRLDIKRVFEGLSYGFRTATPPWTKEQIEQWQAREPALQELFSLDAVRLVTKALNLSYEYANLFKNARIITDIRPVFNVDATDIQGAVVTFTLRLRYDDPSGDHSLSVALDEADVDALKEQCDRAIRKAETAKKRFSELKDFRISISGQEDEPV